MSVGRNKHDYSHRGRNYVCLASECLDREREGDGYILPYLMIIVGNPSWLWQGYGLYRQEVVNERDLLRTLLRTNWLARKLINY